jgi:K+-transporting ATPase A subunit
MLLFTIVQVLVILAALILLAPVLGRYMATVFFNEKHGPFLMKIEITSP